jgi:diamine N-acetyltransferase
MPEPSEAAAVAALARTTFCDTFGHLYTPDDLTLFLDEHKTEAAFMRTLSDGRHVFRVAERDGQMVGYCKLGFDATLPDLPPGWEGGIELKELYLAEGAQGSGVGPALMDWALAEACAAQAPVMILSVWSENFRAQRFYQRYGFAHIADTYFMVGTHRDDEFLYGLKLEVQR